MNKEYLLFLEVLRNLELEKALDLIRLEKPQACSLLEIGAGTGWQAKKFFEKGYQVEAIDLSRSEYVNHRVWDVKDYDGHKIPFPADSFDVIFSSNVLEHIPHVTQFQSELHRVLKPDGIAVHILPSGSWRFWTNLTYYPYAFNFLLEKVFARGPANKNDDAPVASEALSSGPSGRVGLNKIIYLLVPHRHGEKGNTLTEIYYFSKRRWKNLFENTGWKIKKYTTNRIFYTGHLLFGATVPIEKRGSISPILGSSCHLFLLKKDS